MSRKRQRGPFAQPSGAPGIEQANMRRFTTKSWAVIRLVLRQRRDAMAILDLVGFFHWLGDTNVEVIKRRMPPLPCRAGCSYCCYVDADLPDLLPIELFRIVAFLNREGTAVLPEVRHRLAQFATIHPAPLPAGPGSGATRPACLFLSGDRCMIYPVRPLRCRAQHSPDAEACRLNYLGQRETMPILSEPALLYQSIQVGIRLGLEDVGMQSAPLALRRAMLAVSQEPDVLERWANGRPAFGDARFGGVLDEERLLARFKRQGKRQVQSEEAAMEALASAILERPGAWAMYSISGSEPRI
jgi:Fe-S-cluster containining protein